MSEDLIGGTFNIKTDLGNKPNTLVRNPGPGQDVVIIGSVPIHYPLRPRCDQWRLLSGPVGGVIMQNVAFNTFLKVDPKHSETPVTTTEELGQATSFAVTSAGNGKYHIKVAAENLAWTAQLPQAPPGQQYTLDSAVKVKLANGTSGQYWYLPRVAE